MPGRPQPINGRSLLLGGVVVTVVLFLVDGFLGVMAGYAAGSWQVGAAVFGALFAITWLEFAVVAWASRRRQKADRRKEL
jgi:hypothetical protein